MKVNCPHCRGMGFQSHTSCLNCGGKGFVRSDQVCMCGRAAIRVAGATIVCFSPLCYDEATKPKDTSVYPGYSSGKPYVPMTAEQARALASRFGAYVPPRGGSEYD